MTPQEIQQFKETIQESILPHIIHMNEQQITNIVRSTPNISDAFKNMLLEQLFILKEKQKKSPIK
ncbi:MAG: hypothetical protein PHS65_09540 [Arcobacteraceae bacterium]|jgi:hypothetical protein|nr:hypothetical protein [Arcobacteraceae bacterium]MDX9797142.1 hypothetical protein [Arcobacteraceae bacterium]